MGPGAEITTVADVERLWRDMMGAGGFGRRTLWLVLLAPDGRTSEVVMPIDDISVEPDGAMLASLDRVLDEAGAGDVLVLLSRPGSRTMTADDRRWAAAVRRSLGHRSPWPIHLATYEHIAVFAPDDLLAAG